MKPNDLYAQIAHDMRGPLSCIHSGIAFLENLDRAVPERTEILALMKRCAERLNHMVNEVLERRRAEQCHKSQADIAALLHLVCKELQTVASENNISLECLAVAPTSIFIDEPKMERVFQNLIQNAIQAVTASPKRKVTVELVNKGSDICISVRDTGPGLPQEHMDRLFKEEFTTKGKLGNGLGLPYCHTIIKNHGGCINAHDLPNGGAEFMVLLPSG